MKAAVRSGRTIPHCEAFPWPGVGVVTVSFHPTAVTSPAVGGDGREAAGTGGAPSPRRFGQARRVIVFTLMTVNRPLTTTRLVAEANRLGHVLSESTAAKCLRQMVRDGELAPGRGSSSAGYWFAPDADDGHDA